MGLGASRLVWWVCRLVGLSVECKGSYGRGLCGLCGSLGGRGL